VRDVFWSEAALDDTDVLFTYIAADNPTAAHKVLDRIESTAESLGRLPSGRKGRVQSSYEKSVVGLPYIIAYAIRALPSGAEQIVILRVIHTARNWPKGKWSA
jgi:plasmid stabilization system protein ParE